MSLEAARTEVNVWLQPQETLAVSVFKWILLLVRATLNPQVWVFEKRQIIMVLYILTHTILTREI